MKFKVHSAMMISKDCASVRVDIDIVSFDVKVRQLSDRIQVDKPSGIYFPEYQDWKNIIGAVIGEYKKVSVLENVSYEYQDKKAINK